MESRKTPNPFDGSENKKVKIYNRFHTEQVKPILNNKVDTNPPSLLDSPPDILNLIDSFIPDKKSKAAYSLSCKTTHQLFQPDLDTLAKPLVAKLLQHVVYGQKAEVEEMLKKNPGLLNWEGEVEDYSGRTIRGTALKIALGAEDVSINGKDEEMVEMIKRYLKTLSNGEEEIAKQQKEQFPEGWEEKEKERAKNDSAALHKIVSAIGNSKAGEDCETALEEFRNYLKPKDIITTGKHFNVQLLVEAFKLYDRNYSRFGDFGSRKNHLFWCKVIGYIQRFLPACYAQAFCDTFYSVVKMREPLSRDLQLINIDSYFYPLDSNPSFRLGYHFGVWDYYAWEHGLLEEMEWPWPAFEQLCREKTDCVSDMLKLEPDSEKNKRTCALQ